MRLFVALDIPREARDLISSGVASVHLRIGGARWVDPGNLHLTLKFIGAYTEEGLPRLEKGIRAAGERCAPFRAALGGCGAFPSRRRSRVIWVGMCEGAEEAGAVARKLDARLEDAGVRREDRPFRGHITLARLKQPADCSSALEELELCLGELSGIAFDVDEMVLYRSILGPKGPTYVELQRTPLGGKPREKG